MAIIIYAKTVETKDGLKRVDDEKSLFNGQIVPKGWNSLLLGKQPNYDEPCTREITERDRKDSLIKF